MRKKELYNYCNIFKQCMYIVGQIKKNRFDDHENNENEY